MGLLNRAMVGVLQAIPPTILWRFARRYVAGVTLTNRPDGERAECPGLLATLDILGGMWPARPRPVRMARPTRRLCAGSSARPCGATSRSSRPTWG
jgi:hypothetical protein